LSRTNSSSTRSPRLMTFPPVLLLSAKSSPYWSKRAGLFPIPKGFSTIRQSCI
jgi:hypothetical protein